ncbi:MAG TPA: magnesium transporter CorA family protein [Anaeromyxobacteraceae bacterium]|nr:magnesium transporter CorA family protein [Anaeromyxobacteraceae bacterium]
MFRAVRLEAGVARQGGRELCGPGAPLFLDLTPEPEHLAFLRERFGFHPLALEDCATEDERTKYEEYPGSTFIVVHRIGPSPTDDGLHTRELNLFLTAEALVAVHGAPIQEVDRVFERCAADPAVLAHGPDWVLWSVLDALTDAHFDVADHLTDQIEDLATEVVSGPRGRDDDLLPRLLEARRTHALLRRRLAPQREVLAALARPGEGRVRAETAPYFRDVLDHLLRITEEIDTGRDLLGSVMDVHLTAVNNRLTLVTTRLTLVATIFLPLNFVAGWFGMNLEILPPAAGKAIAVGVTLILPPLLFAWFHRKRLL